MTPIIYLFGLFFASGLFFIVADLLKLPTLATNKAMLEVSRQRNVKANIMDTLLRTTAVKASRFVYIDPYKKIRMAHTLTAAGLSESPELFTAQVIVKAAFIAMLALPCFVLMPLLVPVVLFLAILIYFKEIRKADEALLEKRSQIELELPRFVATITQELKASRDVLSILEQYKKNASDTFSDELGILVADMRSSSYEAALTRFEARFNSPMLSDITRGLTAVLRGDDNVVYFQMLTHDMKQLELQRLKAQAMKIPPKIRVFSFAMLMCFMVTYIAVIVYEIITSLTGLF